MMQINARTIKRSNLLVYDLITDENIDLLSCITDTCLCEGEDANLSSICPPGFGVQQLWVNGQGGVVTVVYWKTISPITRLTFTSSVFSLGAE